MGYGAGFGAGYGAGRGTGYGAGKSGVLGAGWGTGFGAGPGGGGGAAPAFSPDDFSGLVVWLDFSDATVLFQDSGLTTPVASDADPIGGVNDKSTANNDFTQATGANRPTYQTAEQGGLSVALGDTTNDSLDKSVAIGTEHTVFYVVKVTETGLSPLFCGEGGAGTNMYVQTSTPKINYAAQGNEVTFSTDVGTAAFRRIIIRRSGTTVNCYVDGVLTDSPKTLAANSTFTILTLLSYAGSFFAATYIAECGAYDNDIGDSNVATLDSYLADKWGL